MLDRAAGLVADFLFSIWSASFFQSVVARGTWMTVHTSKTGKVGENGTTWCDSSIFIMCLHGLYGQDRRCSLAARLGDIAIDWVTDR